MFGNKLIEKAQIPMSVATKKQLDAAIESVNKLAESSGMFWDLMTSKLFDQVRLVCFAQGAAVAAGVIGICALVRKSKDEQKDKTE